MLNNILKNKQIEQLDNGIYTVIEKEHRVSDYDDKVKGYDTLIGNSMYNKLIWGNDVKNYQDFCKEALDFAPDGVILDAGCGSLVFTADVYAKSTNKLIVLLDRSMGMLERAKERLIERCGEVPKHIVFIQGDIFDLPFYESSFDVVMSQGLLHMFDDKKSFLDELKRVKKESAFLSFTSLVGNNMVGRGYLKLLKKAGEVAVAYSSEELEVILDKILENYEIKSIGNMAYMKVYSD